MNETKPTISVVHRC